ncbi:unnamed protein product [Larinioides sclopetarius]|uniref:Endonuclease/exonuclease/phosphatase domain-containing protein n=1 Tax=Larinioides sclopetarius TaxID=280406 RepID=A0AAV1ZBY0_9ARAC
MNNCIRATELAAVQAIDSGADILLLQEQYTNNGKLPSFPLKWTKIFSDSGKASTVVINPQLSPIVVFKDRKSIFIQVETFSGVLQIGNVYIPPSEDVDIPLNSISSSNRICRSRLFIAGDFNSKSTLWGYQRDDSRGNALLDFAASFGLILVNNESLPTFQTRRARGTPDLCFISTELFHLVRKWEVLDIESYSDHRYILSQLDLFPHQKISERYKTTYGPHKAFQNHLKRLTCSLRPKLDKTDDSSSISSFAQTFLEEVKSLINKFYKKKNPSLPAKVKWWSTALAVERNKLRALHRRSRNQNDPNYLRHLSSYNHAKAKYQSNMSIAKERSFKSFCTNTASPFGALYRLTRNKIFSADPFMADLISDDHPVTEVSIISFILDHIFPPFSDFTFSSSPSGLPDELLFTEQELDSAFSNLKKGKAPGPDGVDNNIIKLIYQADKNFLLCFFNKCLKHSCFPEIFKVGTIVLIRKPDKDPIDANSYRPICLLSSLGKVLEELLLRRLEFHAQQIAPISDNQFGFVKDFSTEEEKCVDTILTNLSDISLLKADLSDFSENEDLHPVISAQTHTEKKNNASPPITNATPEKVEMTHRSETQNSFDDAAQNLSPTIDMQQNENTSFQYFWFYISQFYPSRGRLELQDGRVDMHFPDT